MIALSPRVSLYALGEPMPPLNGEALALAHFPDSKAFGDGSHPTTRLCAGAVDLLCRQRRPAAVLDVGTGTGVLARIARARGASVLSATDIDPEALASARAHAALDSHAVPIEVANSAPDSWGPRFNLVVANILEGPLRELAPAIARALAPGAALLLSGFTRAQVPALRIAYEHEGLRFVSESQRDDWALLFFEKAA